MSMKFENPDDYTYVAGIRFEKNAVIKHKYDNETKMVTIFLRNGQRVVTNFEGKSNTEAARNFDKSKSPYIEIIGESRLYAQYPELASKEVSLFGFHLDGVEIYGAEDVKDIVHVNGTNNSFYGREPEDEINIKNFDVNM